MGSVNPKHVVESGEGGREGGKEGEGGRRREEESQGEGKIDVRD